MSDVTRALFRRLSLLMLSSSCVVVLLGFAFSRGLFSPRWLGIWLLAASVGIGTWAVLIIRRSAGEFRAAALRSGPSSGDRKRLGIWACRVAILFLVLSLISGTRQPYPLWARLAGAVFNLCIMAAVIQALVRLQRRQT